LPARDKNGKFNYDISPPLLSIVNYNNVTYLDCNSASLASQRQTFNDN